MINLRVRAIKIEFVFQNDRKFMKKRFKNILLDIHLQPEHTQLAHLNQTLEEWMGNTDQIDDITVLGFRL